MISIINNIPKPNILFQSSKNFHSHNFSIFVARSEQLNCESLGILLEVQGYYVVGKASTFDEALMGIRVKKPAIAILEAELLGRCSCELVRTLKAEFSPTAFILLGNKSTQDKLPEILSCGFCGYINQDDGMKELLNCFQAISNGNSYMSTKFKYLISNQGFKMLDESIIQLLKTLTPRERQILLLIAKGLTANEIAEQLNISYWTLSSHKMKISTKMQLGSSKFLVKFGILVRDYL